MKTLEAILNQLRDQAPSIVFNLHSSAYEPSAVLHCGDELAVVALTDNSLRVVQPLSATARLRTVYDVHDEAELDDFIRDAVNWCAKC